MKKILPLILCILLANLLICSCDTETPEKPCEHPNMSATVVEPTCTAEGYTVHDCNDCDYSYNDTTVPKIAHRFNDESCLSCAMPVPTDEIVANTEWYSETVVTFTLNTKEELAGLASLVNSGTDFTGKTVYLGASIDLGYLNWTPIGTSESAFKGTFDGCEKTISSLRISRHDSYVGLFGNSTGKISNLTIDNATVYSTGANQYVSIVCGATTADMSDIKVDGYIDAKTSSYVGGIVGYAAGQLTNLTSTTNIVAADRVGGICGEAELATAVFTNLKNYATINGGNYCGGIIGLFTCSGTLYADQCENLGEINGKAHTAGILGYAKGKVGSMVMKSKSSAKVSGEYYVGAIIGEALNVAVGECNNEGSSISASSALIENDLYYAYLGGYVGKGYSVESCVNNSNIEYLSRGSYVGGIAGYLANYISGCENTGNISGYNGVGGLAGKIASSSSVAFRALKNSGNVSGKSQVGGIIGEWKYNTFFTVNNCENSGNISGEGDVGGIVGALTYEQSNKLTVSDLKNSGNVTGTQGRVGGLIGYVTGNSESTLANSQSSGNITGLYGVGGLVGWSNNVALKNCSNEGTTITATGFVVEGDINCAYLGGYVGRGYIIEGCINNSDITYASIGQNVGGIIGFANGKSILNCENNGNISSNGAMVGGIAGRVETGEVLKAQALKNTGNISGHDNVGGTIGNINNQIYIYDNPQSHVSDLSNSGNVTATHNYAGGIIGYAYFDNSHSMRSMSAILTNLKNSGEVSGAGEVGEIFGYFDSEGISTLTTYEILGHVTVNGTLNEGEFPAGTAHDITFVKNATTEE